MRRPIPFIAMAFTGGLAFQHMHHIHPAFLIGILLAPGLGYLLFMRASRPFDPGILRNLLILVLAFNMGVLLMHAEENKSSYLFSMEGQKISGEGIIKSVEKKGEDYFKIRILVTSVGNRPTQEETLLSYQGKVEKDHVLQDIPGRRILFKGTVVLPTEARNPETFDYRAYLRTLGIYALIQGDKRGISIESEGGGPYWRILNLLSNIKGNINETLTHYIGSERSGILSGMLWGDKMGISEDTMEQFRMNGTAHILAVSGIHVGVVYIFLNRLFLSRKNIWIDALIMILLIGYAAMASFSSSIIRAVAMIFIHIVSKHAYRRYDLLSSGAFVMILMLLHNPASLLNLGFQLSFAAIFTIGCLVSFLSKHLQSMMTSIIGLQAGLAPMMAYSFNYFSLAAFIANVPVVFMAGLIIPLGMLMVPLTILEAPSILLHVNAYVLAMLVDGMQFINWAMHVPGRSYLHVVSPSRMFMILYYSLLFFGTSELFFILKKRKKHKGILIGMMVLFCIGFYVQWSTANVFNKADLIFVDVGQGDCLHIKTAEGKNILIDGGGSANRDVGEEILMPYLLKNGVSKIDAAFVTHLHQDHYGGIASLARKGMIKRLILYEGNKVRENEIITETGLTKEQLVYVAKGNTVQLGKKSTVAVLWPSGSGSDEALRPDNEVFEREEEDENKNSLILMVDHHGLTVLMTGDIDAKGEDMLMDSSPYKKWLKSDLLKISHHGSRYSSSEPFIQAVDPLVSVIQVGKNTFGHPHSSILDRLNSHRIPVYRNDLRGAIGFSRVPDVPAEQGIRVYTMH